MGYAWIMNGRVEWVITLTPRLLPLYLWYVSAGQVASLHGVAGHFGGWKIWGQSAK
jgi:hypothetical protein